MIQGDPRWESEVMPGNRERQGWSITKMICGEPADEGKLKWICNQSA